MNLAMKGPLRHKRMNLRTRPESQPGTLTPQQLLQLNKKLLQARAALAERVKRLAGEAREETPSYSMHMADAATDSFDRDLTLGLASFEQETLYEIDAALKRIKYGVYGFCELTGKPIPWRRLLAIPWTRFSLDAEKMIKGSHHPHIGELGMIRPTGIETPDQEISERELLAGVTEAG